MTQALYPKVKSVADSLKDVFIKEPTQKQEHHMSNIVKATLTKEDIQEILNRFSSDVVDLIIER